MGKTVLPMGNRRSKAAERLRPRRHHRRKQRLLVLKIIAVPLVGLGLLAAYFNLLKP